MSSRKIQKLAAIVGTNIARRRKAVGLTQEQLAEKLSISGASLSRIEKGMAAPRFPRLEELAEILGCHVADLFRKEGGSPQCEAGYGGGYAPVSTGQYAGRLGISDDYGYSDRQEK